MPALWRVHLGQAFETQDLPEVGSGPLVVCSLLLSALSLCLWCIVLEYALISRFKGVFSGFWAFRGGLVACVLCVDCVALYA